jgi:hypothetical protein
MGEIESALEALFMRTNFPHVSYTLFRRMAQGSLTVEELELLKSLGIEL